MNPTTDVPSGEAVLNHRRLPRIPIIPPLPVTEGEEEVGMLVDATVEGIRLSANHPFAVETLIRPRIVSPGPLPGRDQFVNLEAQCVWCRKLDQAGNYHAGFAIREITDLDLTILKGVIETARRKSYLFDSGAAGES